MKQATALLGFAFFCVVILAMSAPASAQDPGPVAGAMATLAAATAQADQVRASQRATSAAINAEAARLASAAQATARAQSAQATQSALDELQRQRAATATVRAQSAAATQSAMSELARQRSVTATTQAASVAATSTAQAVMVEAQATDAAQLSQTYAMRQQRFTFGLLLVEVFFVCGALFVIGRVAPAMAKMLVAQVNKLHPHNDSAETPSKTVIDESHFRVTGQIVDVGPAQPSSTSSARSERMPSTVQVYDNPRMVKAIDEWAAKYDAAQRVTNGNN